MKKALFITFLLVGCEKVADFRLEKIEGSGCYNVSNYLSMFEKKDSKNLLSVEYEIEEHSLLTLADNNSAFDLLKVTIKAKCNNKEKESSIVWQNRSKESWKYNNRIYYSIARKCYIMARTLCK
jgi:hypothetical protein